MLYTQLPAMFGPINCSTTFNRRSFVQMSFIALLKKTSFCQKKIEEVYQKKTKKFHSLLFANILNDSIAFALDLWFFFPFFLPTVFCHSFIVSFYSFKYESASTFSFFRQKLWKLPIILPSMKYDRNDYGYNGMAVQNLENSYIKSFWYQQKINWSRCEKKWI